GSNNIAAGSGATIAGGTQNIIQSNATYGVVGGGIANVAGGFGSTVGGGLGNAASYFYTTVGGGDGNISSGSYATVPGGYVNYASGGYSFAAGYQAQAMHLGSFVWSDASGGYASTAANQFSVHASGGIRFAGDVDFDNSTYHHVSLTGGNSTGYLYGSYPKWGDGVHLGYNYYADAAGGNHIINAGGGTSRITAGYGSIVLAVGDTGTQPTTQRLVADPTGVTVYGTFNNLSDRNAKQDFASVSPSEMLNRVTQLPLSEWSYK